MGSQAAWDQLLRAYADGDWDQIEQLATALLAWLDRDGFLPKVLPQNLGPHWNRPLARAGCLVALEFLGSEWRTAPEQA